MIAAVHPLATSPEPPSRAPRLLALDLMRGVVMLLMIVDHASLFFNAGRVANDGASMWQAGSALPLPQFLTRFVTHLCAPTFLFLAGAAVAISTDRRTRAGASPASIDRDLLVRGAFIVALDLVYMSTLAGFRLMQVLYAIGVSMMLMPLLRRLPDVLVLASSAAFLVLGELLTTALWSPPENSGLLVSLTLAPYRAPQMAIVYPFVPWLCLMALGHVFARRLLLPEAARAAAPRHVLLMGLSLLALFAAVRGFNGYGNMLLPREDGSLVQWLHVSKYRARHVDQQLARAGTEVAELVEYAVVRQALLPVRRDPASAGEHRGGVEKVDVALGEAHDHDEAAGVLSDPLDGSAARLDERRPEQQVLRRIARNRELRECEEIDATLLRARHHAQHRIGIAFDIADDGVDLRQPEPDPAHDPPV
jgi:uncharacterized membrane protein